MGRVFDDLVQVEDEQNDENAIPNMVAAGERDEGEEDREVDEMRQTVYYRQSCSIETLAEDARGVVLVRVCRRLEGCERNDESHWRIERGRVQVVLAVSDVGGNQAACSCLRLPFVQDSALTCHGKLPAQPMIRLGIEYCDVLCSTSGRDFLTFLRHLLRQRGGVETMSERPPRYWHDTYVFALLHQASVHKIVGPSDTVNIVFRYCR